MKKYLTWSHGRMRGLFAGLIALGTAVGGVLPASADPD
jgi:hypothetical protein